MTPFRQIISPVLMSVIGIALGYVLAQKPSTSPSIPNAVEGWQSYTDATNGFTLNFPLAETQRPFNGEPTTDLAKGQVSLPDAVGNKERWLEVSVLNADSTHLDNNKCFIINDEQKTNNRFFDSRRFCQSISEEGAAGSTYRTDIYTTKIGDNYAVLKFTSRHTNDVHVYGDCEQDMDLAKPLCQNYAFDPIRDLKLFDDIAATLTVK